MLGRARRHPVVSALALLVVVLVIGGAGAVWYLLAEAQQAGRIVSAILSRQLGVPVSVERAKPDGPRRIVLYGVHVPSGPHWEGDVRLRELRIDGGILPIIFPRGQAISIVAVSASITLADARRPAAPPTAAALEALRGIIAESLDWPADVAVEVLGAELRTAGQVFTMDLVGRKSTSGALTVSVKIAPPGGKQALALELADPATGAAERVAGRRVALHVTLDGDPSRLGGLWPAGLPALAHVSLAGDVALPAGGDLEVTGRLIMTLPGEAVPVSAQFSSRYGAKAARLDVSALSLTWGPDIRLSGKATAEELDRLARLTFEMSGTADGADVGIDGSYALATGAIGARVRTGALEARKLLARGGGVPPVDVSVRATRSTLSGTLDDRGGRLTLDGTIDGLEVPKAFGRTPLDGTLRARVALRRDPSGLGLDRLESGALTLTRGGAAVGTVTAQSAGDAAWPIAIEASASDLSRLPIARVPARMTGTAHVKGSVSRAEGRLRFTGDVTADLPRVEVTTGGPTVLLDTRVQLPVTWGTGATPAPGTVFVERVEVYGLTVDRLISSATLDESRLSLPDMKWVHYEGHGSGWLEVAIDGRPVPVRGRLEGERIDLTAVIREYGVTAAKVSGKVRYLLVLQYSEGAGLIIVGQVNSEEGGQVAIDVIEKLLESAQVQGETSGVLKQTLENLRQFDYESLEGDVRVSPAGGRVNLSLVGKKRLGIFPPPVKAINLRNVPISVLARLFSRRDAT